MTQTTNTNHRLIDTSTIKQTPHGAYYTLPGISSMGVEINPSDYLKIMLDIL